MAAPLQVDPVPGERLRFFVHSEENPRRVYLCDVTSYGGIGECSCPHFRTKLAKAIREGRLTLRGTFPRHQDKHLQACRDHIEEAMYAELGARETEPVSTVAHR